MIPFFASFRSLAGNLISVQVTDESISTTVEGLLTRHEARQLSNLLDEADEYLRRFERERGLL